MSLSDVAQATKIRTVTLSAMEREDFDHVPGGIFRRGLLRSYATHVGLDPEDIVTQYRREFEPEPAPAAPAGAEDVADTPIAPREEFDVAEDARRRGHWQLLVGVFAVAAASYLVTQARSQQQNEPAAAIPTVAPRVETRPVAPAATDSSRDTGAVATSGNENALRVQLKARGDCWVTATADGTRAIYRLMAEGQTDMIEAREQIVLRVGAPTALDYSVNGRPGRPLGPADTPITITLTPQNYKTFLRDAS
jgi:cytoskeletal protein RodZ